MNIIFIVFSVAVIIMIIATVLFLRKNKKLSDAKLEEQEKDPELTFSKSVSADTTVVNDTYKMSEELHQDMAVSEKKTEMEVEDIDLSKRERPDTGGLPYVLVAEDNISNYKLIEVMLRNLAVTENAINGKKAVERVKEQDYDMVLMDIKMPVMNGLEATNAIRQFDKNIPIIAVTANVLDFDKNLALANGCNEFVTKPVIRKRLCEVIENYKRK